jgi:membrane dipeptidase
MLIFDAHLDLALNGVDWNRDLRKDVRVLQAQEEALGMSDPGRQQGTVTFPELKKAGVRMGVATLLARQEQATNHPFGWTTAEACYAVCHGHCAYYRAMEAAGWMRLLRTKADLAAHQAACERDPDGAPFGYVLSMECADAVLTPDNIDEWHGLGLRAIGLTHYGANRYGGGTCSEAGLAADAVPLLKRIEQLGIALDLTHLSDRSFEQATDLFGGRVLASHQNARKFSDWQRQFSDEQIKLVIARDGVLGAALDMVMLLAGWTRGAPRQHITLERVVDNIDHVCQLAGNCRHAGIGSDLDGAFGAEQTPHGFKTIADLRQLPELLSKRDYSDADIAAILHGNWLRFFGEVLPAA